MRVITEGLRVRSGPGIGHAIKPVTLKSGQKITVTAVEGADVWVEHADGWSAMRYGGSRYIEGE